MLSDAEPVQSGVAQGSIIGPHLFNAYVDSVFKTSLSTNCFLQMYADDALLVKPILSVADERAFQADLIAIGAAYDQLCLTVNPVKSKLMQFTQSSQSSRTFSFQLELNGAAIESVPNLKYLGVVLDPQLNFDCHAQLTSSRVKQCIGALRRSLPTGTVPSGHFAQIYQQGILPVLTYALPVSAPVLKKSWTQLEKCNRFAARLVLNDYSSSYTDLLTKISWKSVRHLTCECSTYLVFKYMHGLRHYAAGDISVKLPNQHYYLRQHGHPLQLLPPTSINSPLLRLFSVWNAISFPDGTPVLEIFNSFICFKRVIRQTNNNCLQSALSQFFPDVLS